MFEGIAVNDLFGYATRSSKKSVMSTHSILLLGSTVGGGTYYCFRVAKSVQSSAGQNFRDLQTFLKVFQKPPKVKMRMKLYHYFFKKKA